MSSFLNRKDHLNAIKTKSFDLVIVGGGITGAGVARDAAIQGHSVCLVEQNDFAEGTSSRSSKLAHGGLRYLESLEFSLVSEALHERQNLLRMAPHMVRPLKFLMPLYKGDRVGPFKMQMGMILYDLLAAMDTPYFHTRLSADAIHQCYPELKTEGLRGGFVYSDAFMDDDRLVLETLRSAVEEGAHVVSYTQAQAYQVTEEGVRLKCKDQISGEVFEVSARHAISCVGPWTDMFAHLVDENWKDKTRPSKGVHITIPKDKLNLKTAVVMAADKQKRILFCIPRRDFDIIGTTDTDFETNPGAVRTQKEDVDYILNVVREYYPEVNLKKEDILFSYAGVRPLIDDGSESESSVSRDHWLQTYEDHKITFISGGKYTTYLAMAEDCVRKVSAYLPQKTKRKNTRQPFCSYNFEENIDLAKEKILKDETLNWTPEERMHFVERHGVRALNYLDEIPGLSLFQAEAYVAVQYYFCGSLKDFYFRRTPYLLSGVAKVKESLPEVSSIFSDMLDWNEVEEKKQEEQVFSAIDYESAWRGEES